MNILAISGSLQSHSSNSVLIREAAAQQPPDIVVRIFERLGEPPHFNRDLDGDFPAEPIAGVVFSTTVAMQRAGDGTATVDSAAARILSRAPQELHSAVAGSCPTSG